MDATLTLQAGETVTLYTAFADNALDGPDTGAAPAVTKAASAAATAASDGAKAGAIAEERASWWSEYWGQSSISLPSRTYITTHSLVVAGDVQAFSERFLVSAGPLVEQL